MSGIGQPVIETIVPAQPGWAIVVPVSDEENSPKELHRIAVIAWLIQTFRRSSDETTFVGITPITPHGDVSDLQQYALQYGDRPPFLTFFEDLDDETALKIHFRSTARKS